MEKLTITIQAEEIAIFGNFQRWVDKASSQIGGYQKNQKIICVDKNGNTCTDGKDFMFARDNDLFPVKAYRLIRSSE